MSAAIICILMLGGISDGSSQNTDSFYETVANWDAYYNQHPELTTPASHEYKIYMRWKTFLQNRIYCMDSTISGKPAVIQAAMNNYLNNVDYYNRAGINGSDWKLVGPFYPSEQKNGLVSAVWVDTVGDPSLNTIYIGTNSSGIFKTTNGGLFWENLTDNTGLDLIGVTDIKGDPSNPNILFVSSGGGGLGRDFSYSIGILWTQDAGESWQILYGQEPSQTTSVNCILVDPSNPNILYAGIRHKLFRFTRYGLDWEDDIIAEMPRDTTDTTWANHEYRCIRDIEMKPGAPDTLYVATDNQFYTNHRKAQIWRITGARSSNPVQQRIDQLLPSNGPVRTNRFELAVTPQYPDWIYAQATHWDYAVDTLEYFAIWRSKDDGLTWEKKYEERVDRYQNSGLMGCGRVDYYKNELILNSKDTSVFYIGGNTMTRVVDWQNDETTHYGSDPDYHVDTRAAMLLRSSPIGSGTNDIIFAGNDGGISKTTDGINSWENLNGEGLVITQFYSIGTSEVANSRYCGGTVDNKFFSFDGATWYNSGEETSRTVVDPQSPNFVYTNPFSPSYGDDTSPTARSNNYGINWYNPHLISTPLQKGHFNRPLELNPLMPKTLITGAYDVFKTYSVRSQQACSTYKIPVHIGNNYAVIDSSERLINIAISPLDSSIFYLAYDGPHWDQDSRKHKLLKTTDNGQSFVDLLNSPGNSDFLDALYNIGISDICLSPANTNKVWVSLSGFDYFSNSPSDVHKRVFFSIDAGLTFVDYSTGLPNFPVNCIAYWPGGNDRLFAGTDIGVYYRDAGMERWMPFTTGMPKTIISEIAVLPNANVIRVSTFGRGMYESDLSCMYVEDTLLITSDTTFSQPFTTDRSILVKAPAVLTIQTTVKFPPLGKIMVEPGAVLILNRATLTNACFNMWRGIEVWGNRNLSQIPSSNQGMVMIQDSSIIKNSRFGISAAATDEEGNILWNTTGGIIKVYNSVFQNNYKDVQFLSFAFSNSSVFRNVLFETKDELIDGQSFPSEHISMYDVNGVQIQGCTIRNTSVYRPEIPLECRGNGIRSINSSYAVTELCLNQMPPCPGAIRSSISGLNYGILTYNYEPVNSIVIKETDVENNRRGIYLGNSDYATVVSNSFQIPLSIDGDTCYGLYLGSSTGYQVEGNTFKTSGNNLNTSPQFSYPPREIGLVVDNSGGLPNEIYRNRFDSLDVAILAQRVNRSSEGGGSEEGDGGGGVPVNPNTGLVLKCNTYNENSVDEMIARETPTGVEGIARDQGNPSPVSKEDLAGNTFSPYHESAQLPESDIKNEGNFVFYYHHIQLFGQDKPRVRPDFYTIGLVQPAQRNYGFDSACCPSNLGSGEAAEELKTAMATESDSIAMLSVDYLTLVDGGETETLNEEVFFSLPPDAVALHQALLGESPYLSDTVMKSAIEKESVLPNAMIRDILAANPQSAKTNSVLEKLNDRVLPMPEPMMNEILAGQSQISPKEVLEGEIAFHSAKRKQTFNRLVRDYKMDMVSPSAYDSLLDLLSDEPSIQAKYLLAFEYLKQGDTTQALSTLNAVPAQFILSGNQQTVYAGYVNYFSLLTTLKREQRSIMELTQDETAMTETMAASNPEPIAGYARNILRANQTLTYREPILLPDLTKSTAVNSWIKTGQISSEKYFRLFPNPAKDYVIIEYSVKEYQKPSDLIIFVITNQEGKMIENIQVNKQQDQFFLQTGTFKSGNYICSMYAGGNILQSQKFILIK